MIIIGEKLNGSIPSVAKAIAERDADLSEREPECSLKRGLHFWTYVHL